MKRAFLQSPAATFLLLKLLVVVGCGGGGDGPEGVVKKHLAAAKAGDFEKSISYILPSQLEQPGAKEKLVGLIKAGYGGNGGIDSYTVEDAVIEGDRAVVEYHVKMKSGDEESSTINCVRQGGKWYLSVN